MLKGALLMLAWFGETIRPTRDADLLGLEPQSDEALAALFKEVCAVTVEADGMRFDPDTVRVSAIREGDAGGGCRVRIQGRLGNAKLDVQVDVGWGDAVTPAARWLKYPSMLGFPPPRLPERNIPQAAAIACGSWRRIYAAQGLLESRPAQMKRRSGRDSDPGDPPFTRERFGGDAA